MAGMKREEWLKLTPRGKLAHRIKKQIAAIDVLQIGYDRGSASDLIKTPIAFMERPKSTFY